ncbi:MAG: glycine--tRNA ligase [Candidatus Ryanbacteria bacterium RIFCSPLOWO2_02_FULL_45_11c]|uniref:glycine--tRNA ligase n=1 Tax=Candidatus Ryanbacteria bacterium RIFCSPLOWO2_02_FULL_45_11c TaxID=1802128 RepID=A0A1G2GUF7_9BACT|nr:MAG: glycine--tRNA ligase [Candidatus Ryanbacteria bacterium RIFCSPLOWO2_02_FULL_45_11c]
MEKIISLCKRRGFIFPGSEIYGGLANSWDYGPLGVELKNNIKQMWWDRFVRRRSDIFGLDAALIMNTRVWEASGHLKEFSDPLVECKKCHERFRSDQLEDTRVCPVCGGELTEPLQFNLMLKTFLGPAQEKANEAYFRPETAQGMFVNFKNVLDTMRPRLPFGIAQAGKAFRNEITPGNFIFRTREFEQMEIEYFIRPPIGAEWEEPFDMWKQEMKQWIANLGVDASHVHEVEIPENERAHYSKRTVDFEYDFPFGRKELYGLAYRTDFDLKNHEQYSGQSLKYRDPDTNEEFWPYVIEPTWGVDRSVLVTLLDAYREVEEEKGTRVFLKLPPKLAPYQVAVFPLLANKPQLVEKAQSLYLKLQASSFMFHVSWDARGNVGKRYYAQDEIGTPWCVTIDFQTLEDDTVTVRDRDTTEQVRKSIVELDGYLGEMIK